MLNGTIADAGRETYGRSRPPLTIMSLAVPPSRTSRSSPRLSRPTSSLKRPPLAPTSAMESTTKLTSPRRENRQTANERAVRVYSPRVAVSAGGSRPRSPPRSGPTSPRGLRPTRSETRPPSAARRRPTASEDRDHPLPWPLHDGSFGGQVRVSFLMLRGFKLCRSVCKASICLDPKTPQDFEVCSTLIVGIFPFSSDDDTYLSVTLPIICYYRKPSSFYRIFQSAESLGCNRCSSIPDSRTVTARVADRDTMITICSASGQ